MLESSLPVAARTPYAAAALSLELQRSRWSQEQSPIEYYLLSRVNHLHHMGVLLSCRFCRRRRRYCRTVSPRTAACLPTAACCTACCAPARGGNRGCRLQHGACPISPQVHGVGQRLVGSCCRRLGSRSCCHSCTHFLRGGHLLPPAVAVGPRLDPTQGATSARQWGTHCSLKSANLHQLAHCCPTPCRPASPLPHTPIALPITPPVVLPHGDQLGTDGGHEAAVEQRDALAQGHGGGCLPQVLPGGLQGLMECRRTESQGIPSDTESN